MIDRFFPDVYEYAHELGMLIADFDQFAAAQTGLACGDDVPYK